LKKSKNYKLHKSTQ